MEKKRGFAISNQRAATFSTLQKKAHKESGARQRPKVFFISTFLIKHPVQKIYVNAEEFFLL
jgi:hypothetical protein